MVGDRYNAPESETKHFSITEARSSVFVPVLHAPLSTVQHKEGEVMLQWRMLKERISDFREPKSLMMDRKLA